MNVSLVISRAYKQLKKRYGLKFFSFCTTLSVHISLYVQKSGMCEFLFRKEKAFQLFSFIK